MSPFSLITNSVKVYKQTSMNVRHLVTLAHLLHYITLQEIKNNWTRLAMPMPRCGGSFVSLVKCNNVLFQTFQRKKTKTEAIGIFFLPFLRLLPLDSFSVHFFLLTPGLTRFMANNCWRLKPSRLLQCVSPNSSNMPLGSTFYFRLNRKRKQQLKGFSLDVSVAPK